MKFSPLAPQIALSVLVGKEKYIIFMYRTLIYFGVPTNIFYFSLSAASYEGKRTSE